MNQVCKEPGSPRPGVNLLPCDPTQGKYAWHWHNLQHEDNDMMHATGSSVKLEARRTLAVSF